MTPYTKKIIEEFLERIRVATTSTPADDYLFTIRDLNDTKLLSEDQARNRARRDIQASVAF